MTSGERGEPTFGLVTGHYSQPCQQVAAQKSPYPWPYVARANSLLGISLGLCCHGHLTKFSREGQDNPHPPAQPGPISGQIWSADRCGMFIRPLSLGQPRGLWLLGPKLQYQVTNKLAPRAPKVRLPRVGWVENTNIIHQRPPAQMLPPASMKARATLSQDNKNPMPNWTGARLQCGGAQRTRPRSSL